MGLLVRITTDADEQMYSPGWYTCSSMAARVVVVVVGQSPLV